MADLSVAFDTSKLMTFFEESAKRLEGIDFEDEDLPDDLVKLTSVRGEDDGQMRYVAEPSDALRRFVDDLVAA